jgi:hypothetical protein
VVGCHKVKHGCALQGEDGSSGLRHFKHPLYVVDGKHEKLKRFAWGCFLLGTNVQALLAAHGVTYNGAQYLLENLEKLVAAARSSGLSPSL